ncbi:MAG: sugar ABC transporter permease [Bacillota bacterium]
MMKLRENGEAATDVNSRSAGTSRKIRMTKLQKMNLRSGLLFTSPWLVGLVVFTVYPILASLYYSLTDYSLLRPPEWVGLDNYRTLVFQDPYFWTSLYNTVFLMLLGLPLGMVIGLAVALLLNTKVRGLGIYRTIYYLPSVVPGVATALVWSWVLNPEYGLVNALLDKFGIIGPGWLTDPLWAKPALVIMGIWGAGGSMVIYLAGLQGIAPEYLEAAQLDGASWWQKLVHIILPMLSPVIFFTLIMGVISSFQQFTHIYVMTRGGPSNSTLVYAMYLYQNAFGYFKMGYASAMAWILFIIMTLAIWFAFRTAGWVHYEGAAGK